jgi:hypothetical protein
LIVLGYNHNPLNYESLPRARQRQVAPKRSSIWSISFVARKPTLKSSVAMLDQSTLARMHVFNRTHQPCSACGPI